MVHPSVTKRKKQRSLQQMGSVTGDGVVTSSRLSPHQANIDRQHASSSSIGSSVAGGNDRKTVGLRLASSIPATPEGNTVSDLTIGASDKFNAFRVNEKSTLESYKQSSFKLKDDIFRNLKFVTNDSMMEFSMDQYSLCQYVCKETVSYTHLTLPTNREV